jgi:SAM-dependent methyltransferase
MSDSASIDLEKTYDRRFAALASYRAGVWSVLTRQFFQPLIPADSAVLDLGCGWGEFINHIQARQKFGMDLNPASRHHLAGDVRHLAQDCSERWALADSTLDTVFTSNFLEHLPDKAAVQRTLSEAFRCLKPGAQLICVGPNIKVVGGAYWDFFDHFVALSERSLGEAMELAGFTVTRSTARFLPYTMSQGFRPPLWTVTAYVKLPFLWRFFGHQFLIVGVKRE